MLWLLALGIVTADPSFTGGLLGVRAHVKLLEDYNRVTIELKRVPPFASTLRGVAWIRAGKAAEFELDDSLKRALKWRGIGIQGLRWYPYGARLSKCERVVVSLSLPTRSGHHEIELSRDA